MNIQIRPYEDTDEAAIWAITDAPYRDIYQDFAKSTLSIAELEGRLVGWMHLHVPQESLYSGFVFIYVAPAYRRQQIGTALYASALRKLCPVGCNWWSSYPESEGADRFALALGFDYTNTNSHMLHNGQPVKIDTDGVRPCRPEDYPIVPDIWSKEYAAMQVRIGLSYERRELTEEERQAEQRDFLDALDDYFALEIDGTIIGMGSLFDGAAGIGALAVDSRYAGRGYGTLLAAYMTNECIRRGNTAPHLYCESGNDNALHVYQKIGYQEISRETVAFKK